MKQLIRKLALSRVADSYALLRSDSLSSPRPTAAIGRRRRTHRKSSPANSGHVPAGHVPVYVGEERERFVISADVVNHPIFVKLLNKSAQEYGYEQKGALRIPCNVVVFEKVLEALRCGDEGGDDVSRDVYDLINSLPSSSDGLFL